MDADAPWVDVCSTADVSEDTPLQRTVDGIVVAVFRLGSDHFVIADQCTHGPGSLSEGWVENGEIECPFHAGRFDIRTGRPTLAPCTVPLQTWQVRVSGDRIEIQPSAARIDACRGASRESR